MRDTPNKITPEIKRKFVPFRCPNCNGFTTVTHQRLPCPVCKARGYVVIDQETGIPVDNNNYEK